MSAVVGDELLRSFDIRNPETQKSERAKNSRTVEFHSNSRIDLVIRLGHFGRARLPQNSKDSDMTRQDSCFVGHRLDAEGFLFRGRKSKIQNAHFFAKNVLA